jgi:hypothetical protein
MPPRRRAALIADLGLVGLALAAAACSGGSDDRPASTWNRIDPEETGLGGPSDLVLVDRTYVGVGADAAWTSLDGLAWTRHDVEAGANMAALVAVEGTYLAVGGSGGQGRLWRSDDGTNWAPLDDVAALEPAPGYESIDLVDVDAGSKGIVVAGTEWGSAGQRPMALFSEDGVSWERAAPAFDGSGARHALAMPDGFVIVGADNSWAGEVTRAAFWQSSDGVSWRQVADDPANGNMEAEAVVARGATLVAAGFRVASVATPDAGVSAAFAPAVWTSGDGVTWVPLQSTGPLDWWSGPRPSPMLGLGDLHGTMISSLAPTADGFLAAGTQWGVDPSGPVPSEGEPPPTATSRIVLWRSPDGTTWERVPDDPTFDLGQAGFLAIRRVLAFDDLVYLLGASAEAGATIWRLSDR